MELKPELRSPWVPDVGVRFLPEEEQKSGGAFYDNMRMLQKWSDDFACSAALLDFAYAQRTELAKRWCFIAARNGGLAVRNYGEVLSAARGLLGKVPTWRGVIDAGALKRIDKAFAERFPRISKLRHAVAHPEFYANPSIDMRGGPYHGPGMRIEGAGSTIQDALMDRTYVTTINGMSVSYDLTYENALFLATSTREAYAALQNVIPK